MATHQTAKTQYVSTPDGTITFAYRHIGTPNKDNVPLLFLIHFRVTIDKLDPLLINSIAQSRPVILDSAGDMATFMALLGVKELDVLGFSIGGFVARLLALNHADGDRSKGRKLIICGSTASVGPDMPETDNG
ncbi:uncharacterized protein Z519_10906 [Cladophialophora bantiana CBS 173.52]|uniref:AB hydrolase-1 domain-containing protein n=1 Tax=Cladophialophora bantiana (strain ATCC 10958 / CBS 173.52 / CDC B-1940 / NIH 8579) TaxID=1442370 RepID=A0A0D2H4W5_CLAB1|nr:uncharacterized protein Z519_10906 [Cladophialophora bantiana CBS 173.52]KIW88338.1 hypothetical protein Z519_10906 [Cladophialophora bantiana CBS 173.52]